MHWKKYSYIPACIILCVLFILFWSIDLETYRNHHKASSHLSQQQYLSRLSLFSGPRSEKWLIDQIDATKKRAWIAVYTFTLPSLRDALKRAKDRGVDVRVILEKFPFWNTTINRETEEFFKKNAIPLHQSGAGQFAFMHAKYMIFDDRWTVETANWTRASFASNREFFMQWDDVDILAQLAQIFQSDFSGKKWVSHDVRLLAGPTNARERILDFLDDTGQSIAVYAPSFSDQELLTHLTRLCYSGRIIQILLANYEEDEEIDYDSCLQVRTMKKPLHAKVLIRDKSHAFVGSFNYTKNSLENNREIGIFISGEAVPILVQTFQLDWKNAVALH